MPGLRRLHLYRTKVTDRGLAAIGSMTSLSELGIYYSPIGDPAVETLKRLKGIRGMRLYGTKISLAAKDELTAALELEKGAIDHRQGAFLGVSCQTLGQQCELANVLEASPAEKAGLRAGDIIVSFAGKKVRDFESLTEVISQHGVDEVVEVEYLRRTIEDNGDDTGEQSFKTKVTLGEWAVDQVQRQPRP
jgi:membrane-associated protease RseP (regulator of RpoE activity)